MIAGVCVCVCVGPKYTLNVHSEDMFVEVRIVCPILPSLKGCFRVKTLNWVKVNFMGVCVCLGRFAPSSVRGAGNT